jgi:hypothetical protein
MIKKVLLLTLAMMLSVGAIGQTLEENLGSMLSTNAEMYLQPLGDAFGASMNSGWYHRAKVHKMLGFDVSIKMLVAAVPSESEFFNFSLNENKMQIPVTGLSPIELSFAQIYAGSNTRTPTFFGPADSAGLLVVNPNLSTVFEDQLADQVGAPAAAVLMQTQEVQDAINSIQDFPLPPGIGLAALPLPMPQISLGLPMGIELTVRGFPESDLGDIGKFSMYGGGVRVNIDQFIPIPLFPVDITAGAFYSQMSIGNIIESSNTQLSLQVGKSINLLIFGLGIYADAAYETSNLSIGYDVDPSFGIANDRIQFDMTPDPGVRLGAGIHLKLIPLTYINLHVSQTPTNSVVTAGFGISLR